MYMCVPLPLCGTYMHIHHPDMHIIFWAYMAYMPSLMDIFVSDTYFAIICEVEVASACVLPYICKHVGSLWPFNMFSMGAIFGMWQLYLFSDICYYMCTVLLVEWLVPVNSYLAYMYIHPLNMHVKSLAYMPHLVGLVCFWHLFIYNM